MAKFLSRLKRGRAQRKFAAPETRACVKKFHRAHNAGVVELADT